MLLDQQTYDRLNTMEVNIESLKMSVKLLANLVFPQDMAEPTELTEIEAAQLHSESEGTVEEELIHLATEAVNVRKDKKNEPTKKTKPKAKKKTVRKTS